MSFEIRQATRTGVVPLIDLYSESGCGKTMSGLLLARGLVGPTGDIALVDTESRRGSLYADVIPGGYKVLDLDAPFTPARYIEALQAVFASGAKVAVVDSMSHEWEGIDGVCDAAAANERKSGKPGLHNWKDPKMEHQKLVQFLLRSPIPLICCIRAKYKTRQKKENGKTVIVRDEMTSPIQAEDFIFEATCHAEILPDHSINLTKCSHPSLRECFPTEGPITIKHGELIAKWCASPGTAPKSEPVADARKGLIAAIWSAGKSVRGTEKSWDGFEIWALENKLISDTETIKTLPESRLQEVLTGTKILLESQPA